MLALVTWCFMVGYAVGGSVNNCISRCDFMDGQCTQAIINPDGSCLTTSKSTVHYGGKGRDDVRGNKTQKKKKKEKKRKEKMRPTKTVNWRNFSGG